MGQRNMSQASGNFSNLSGMTGFEDDFNPSSNKKAVHSKLSSPLNTSGSSITDEVFMNALALKNLDDSDEELKDFKPSSHGSLPQNSLQMSHEKYQHQNQMQSALHPLKSNLMTQFNMAEVNSK